MKRYLIEAVKCGVSDGGIACGPVSGVVVAALRFNDGSGPRWLTMIEAEGMLMTYLTEQDFYDKAVAEDYDEEDIRFLNEECLDSFDGIELSEDYFDIFESIAETPDAPAVPLIRYMIALIRCSMEEVDGLIRMAAGRYADELEVPMSDKEEDYLEEQEYGQEDE